MSALDSCGFPLATLSADERRSRAACLSGGASLVKAWTVDSAPLQRSWPDSANPRAPPPRRLRQLARAGCPPALRAAIWLNLSGGALLSARSPPDAYARLARAAGRGSGGALASRAAFCPFPTHPVLGSPEGVAALRRVCVSAAAWLAENSGGPYDCEATGGPNDLARSAPAWPSAFGASHAPPPPGLVALAALVLAVNGPAFEERAFWTLAGLAHCRLGAQLLDPASPRRRLEVRALTALLARRCARLARAAASCESSLEALLSEWVGSAFASALPPEAALRVVDCAMVEGADAPARAALALCRAHEPALLAGCRAERLAQVLKWRVARTWLPHSFGCAAGPAAAEGSVLARLGLGALWGGGEPREGPGGADAELATARAAAAQKAGRAPLPRPASAGVLLLARGSPGAGGSPREASGARSRSPTSALRPPASDDESHVAETEAGGSGSSANAALRMLLRKPLMMARAGSAEIV